jgi:DNA-binding response OmpR family regulator
VIAATSVDEALDALDRFRPDVLVSDIRLPDRDGFDLVREVRARVRTERQNPCRRVHSLCQS